MPSKKAKAKAKRRKKKDDDEYDPQGGAIATRAAMMIDAARCGDVEALGRLIDGGVDVDATERWPGSDGLRLTALHAAMAHNQQAAAQLLLDRGADPSLASSTGWTPLMTAADEDSLPRNSRSEHSKDPQGSHQKESSGSP